ncbi:MAG: ATP phosphoribosyltransferase regulatory subunit [Palaeococcus sp.]|uniref:ATP phosphoribosyltransferase regulatory subunit n=1 Tax=Palaeococcus sp. (in: euryarchaeotes) TaxID=2820298 RepID=UPI0025E1051B|nr:ATP phosphoribosyltransferase regulatory subunit [Palaeococcus sp. (in: euryarchaeotes)]MCD6559502.1 ATP phosphoribosyltransferase regulatory subunit [Palaeococcus sp. (in: euryarchaeotes)]
MKKDLFSESERLADITKYLRRTFELWGYREVFLPSIEEFNEDLRKGTKFAYNNEFYIIKPDLTSQILTNLKVPRKLKLYYISEVLNGGVKGEWQAGLEFIGGKDTKMQVEVLLAVISSLEALGIEEFYIDVGSLKVWENVLKDIEEFKESVFNALTKRNFEIIERLPINEEKKEELWKLFNFRGRRCTYEKLNRIVEMVDDKRIFIDFGTIRPLPYYSDIIFEVYSPKIGKPLGGGGEYIFKGVSAFGFAFDLNALSKLFDGKIEKSRKKIKGELKEAYKLARALVKLGIPVEVE